MALFWCQHYIQTSFNFAEANIVCIANFSSKQKNITVEVLLNAVH